MTEDEQIAYAIRLDALTLAAQAFASERMGPSPKDVTNAATDLWALAWFFESYLRTGAAATAEVFGPKTPSKPTIVQFKQ